MTGSGVWTGNEDSPGYVTFKIPSTGFPYHLPVQTVLTTSYSTDLEDVQNKCLWAEGDQD